MLKQVHVPEQPTNIETTATKKRRVVLTRNVKRILWATVAATILTILIAVIYSFMSTRYASSPSFQTILPANTSINALGGWTRVSPPGQAQVFSYSDNIDGIPVRVSEQQMPANSTVSDIAKGYNSTNKITAGKTTVYIGNNFQGAQSVIFSENGLLVLIGSTATISNDSWVAYIQSLQ